MRKTAWRKPSTAPVSTPLEQVFFLASCPDDDWSPGGNVHFACRYAHHDEGYCMVIGSNQPRRYEGWMPIPKSMGEEK